jgi:homoserine dehydrogenase
MSDRSLIVLKFGSSVLASENDLPAAVHEIYRWLRKGHRVLAVVSALGKTTDSLLERAYRFSNTPDENAMAALVSTGEAVAAAEFCLALDRAGIPACGLDATRIGLITNGPVLDASPYKLDTAAIQVALEDAPVVVVPGFVGRNSDGHTTLLGRGGSDLTALFLAQQLKAARCLLIKDVDGLYEWDPAVEGPSPRRYCGLTWDDALSLTGRIVQHKAVQFAKDHGLSFEVTNLGSENGTVIGAGLLGFYGPKRYSRPLRIGLLGLGTVGYGVYQELITRPDLFEVAGIAVRNLIRPNGQHVPRHLLTNDAWSIFEREIDVLVELIGGYETPRTLIATALEAGIHTVTANKNVASRDEAELRNLAAENNADFRYSAAVGGSVPMLETVRRIANAGQIASLQGVVNGTTNYILGLLAKGVDFDAALKDAQECGFAETDPTFDLDGTDAAHKLILLADAAFGARLTLADVERSGIDTLEAKTVLQAKGQSKAVRLVASLKTQDGELQALVAPETLEAQHPFAQVHAEWNGLLIKTNSGKEFYLTGKGAGRWPTTESVLADLFDIARSRVGHIHSERAALHARRSA